MVDLRRRPKANIAGDWKRQVENSGSRTATDLHLQKAEGAAWKATLDSVDQAANGIPVANVTVEGNHLHLDIAAVKGTYDAELSPDANTISGRWKQASLDAPLNMTRGDITKAPDPNDKSARQLPCSESGRELGCRATKFRVRFTMTKNDNGQIIGKFDSIDQGAMGIPISGISLTGFGTFISICPLCEASTTARYRKTSGQSKALGPGHTPPVGMEKGRQADRAEPSSRPEEALPVQGRKSLVSQ